MPFSDPEIRRAYNKERMRKKRGGLHGHKRRYLGLPKNSPAYNRLREFGILPDVYNMMLEAQGGVCAICKKPERHMCYGKVRSLAVDHNHQTGEIRGLLCVYCNTGLGSVHEDVAILEAMVAYLKEFNE